MSDSLNLERFLTAVRSGAFHTAQAELRNAPDLAAMSIHAACSIGDVDAGRYHLDRDPQLVDAKYHGWSPLIYSCASKFHTSSPRRSVA